MRILDRYITKSVVSTFIATVFVFCCLYVLIDAATNLDDLIERKVSLLILFQYYSSLFPTIITQTAPIACLLATLFCYSHLNHNNEIIALRTSGLNFWRIARPALATAVVVSMLIFWLNERYVPETGIKAEKIREEELINKNDSKARTQEPIKNLTFYGLKNRLYFIDRFDPATYDLEGITIIGFDNHQNIQEKIVAWKGKWTGILWKFYNCQITKFNEGDPKSPIKVKVYPEKLMDIREGPRDFLRQRLNVSAMNIRQLADYIARFSNSGATKAINNLRVDLYQKYAYPFGNIVIILVGLPLAIMTGRRKIVTFASLGLAILIGFLFYVSNAVGLALGKGGMLHPLLSAWLAPILFLLVALYIIKVRFS